MMEKTPFLNIGINIVDTGEALEICDRFLESDVVNRLFFVNAHCFNVAQRDPVYLELLNDADLVLNDGTGMKIGSKLLGVDLKENMNGTDLIPKLLELCLAKQKRVFLLGAEPGVAETAKERLEKDLSAENLITAHHGFLDDPLTNASVVESINRSRAELLVVGMGVPMQERWITDNIPDLEHVRIAVGGGAVIDFFAGKFRRAPRWARKAGIEWLFRFFQEPVRLFGRYFIGNFVFFGNLFKIRRSLRSR